MNQVHWNNLQRTIQSLRDSTDLAMINRCGTAVSLTGRCSPYVSHRTVGFDRIAPTGAMLVVCNHATALAVQDWPDAGLADASDLNYEFGSREISRGQEPQPGDYQLQLVTHEVPRLLVEPFIRLAEEHGLLLHDENLIAGTLVTVAIAIPRLSHFDEEGRPVFERVAENEKEPAA